MTEKNTDNVYKRIKEDILENLDYAYQRLEKMSQVLYGQEMPIALQGEIADEMGDIKGRIISSKILIKHLWSTDIPEEK